MSRYFQDIEEVYSNISSHDDNMDHCKGCNDLIDLAQIVRGDSLCPRCETPIEKPKVKALDLALQKLDVQLIRQNVPKILADFYQNGVPLEELRDHFFYEAQKYPYFQKNLPLVRETVEETIRVFTEILAESAG